MTRQHADALKALVKAGRCTAEELQQYSPKELEAIAKVTYEYMEQGESLTIKAIEANDYAYKLPDITQFVEDPYYLGNELGYPLDDSGKPNKKELRQLYTFWLTKLDELYRGNYDEVLATGGIGLGKTTFMNIIAAYDYARLSALKEPQRHYGLMPSTKLVLAFFNIYKIQANDVGYAQFQELLSSSPFFRKTMFNNTKLKEGFRMQPPAEKRIAFIVGSRIGHTLGRAVFAAQIDEANFGQEKVKREDEEKKSQVYNNYVSLLSRKDSRNLRAAGHFCLGSSKKTHADFLERHIEQARNRPGAFVIDASQYEVKKCRGYYSGATFSVLLGDVSREPRILSNDEQIPPDLEPYIEKVPVELRTHYELNLIEAIRDITGKAAQAKTAFIGNRDAIRNCLDTQRKPPWHFSSSDIPNTLKISFYEKDMIQDALIKEELFCDDGHLPYRSHPRFIAVDTAYATDAVGIAMGCKGGVRIIERDGKKLFVPRYYVDFVIRVKGMNKEEFPLYKIREFVRYLITDLGIHIVSMTTDGFQSVQLRQEIKIAFPSMDVELLSMDETDSHYITMRNLFYNDAVSVYEDTNLLVEIFDLLHLSTGRRGTKGDMYKMVVDHPAQAADGNIGRKDVADALGAMLSACRTKDHTPTMEEARESAEEFAKADLDVIMKDATDAADAALKEADDLIKVIDKKESTDDYRKKVPHIPRM